jgi:transcriptional regulator with XRE-family HTH domain
VSSRNVSIRFGERLRQLREKAGLSQVEMAHKFGIDRGHISELENGKRKICLSLMETLADGFKVSISELMKGI